MACGGGLYIEAGIATAIVYMALRFIGVLESRSRWKRYPMLYEVRGSDERTMFADIFCVLDKERLRLNVVERDTVGEMARVTFTVSVSSARHKQLLTELVACDATDHVACYRDEEED
jgi:putative Mg2+ transporter-C (MgtC) family protein